MVLTLTVEPAVEREARTFAEERGTTLDVLVGDFLEGLARRKSSRPAFFDVPHRLTEEGAAELRAARTSFDDIARPRTPGGLSGDFWMADDFDDTPPEVVEAFENASV